MPQDLRLDPQTGDLAIGADGNLGLIGGAEAVAQQVRVTLQIGRGEIYQSPGVGLDWLTYATLPDELIAGDVRGVVDSVPGVVDVDVVAERTGARLEVRVAGVVDLQDRRERIRFSESLTIGAGG